MLTEQNGIQVDKFYPPTDWQYSFPEGYTRLEYLESTGTQWIDTGIVPNDETGIQLTIQDSHFTQNANFVGSRINQGQRFVCSYFDTNYWGYGFNSLVTSTIPVNQNILNTISLNYYNSRKFIVNNSEENITDTISATLPTIILFGQHRGNVEDLTSYKLCSCQITQGTTLVRNYVPVKRNSDNKPGMYDLVNDVFYVNQGTGEFVMGSELYSNNSQIDIRQKNNTNFVEKYKFNENNELVWANPQLNLSGPVGYTKVGNLTITDNVVSGFSESDYLQTIKNFNNTANNIVIQCKFTVNNNYSTSGKIMGVYFSAASDGFTITSSTKKIRWYINGNTNLLESESNYITFGNTYVVKGIIFSGIATLYCGSDENNLEIVATKRLEDFSVSTHKPITFGVSTAFNTPFEGSIDLKETYIKVNDKLWFYGKNYTSENYAPVSAGLNYNNTTTPSIGYVNTQTQEFIPAPTDGIKYLQTRDIKVIPPEDNTITLLYGTDEIHYLPNEYRELKGINFTGSQSINTEFKPNQNTRVLIKFNINGGYNNQGILGCDYFRLSRNGSTSLSDIYGTQGNNLTSFSANKDYVVNKNKNKTIINNSVFNTYTEETFQANENLVIGTYGGNWFYGCLYYCKVWDNGTLIKEFIPCERKSDNVTGMYDTVQGVFYEVNSTFVELKYRLFGLLANTSSGTYDVYIDDVLYATTASGTQTDIDFSTLGSEYVSIGTCTTPEELVLHKIVIKPTTSGETITAFRCARTSGASGTQDQGVLWCHFELENMITLNALLYTYQVYTNNKCMSITAQNNTIFLNSFNNNITGVVNVEYVPIFDGSKRNNNINYLFLISSQKLKRLIINNNDTNRNGFSELLRDNQVCEQITGKYSNYILGQRTYSNNYKLKILPEINKVSSSTTITNSINLSNLYPTKINLSTANDRTQILLNGSSSYPMRGLRGLKVSNEAPFTGTSPQINVSYTGLDRDALVELFNSMPGFMSLTKVGSPTISDGIVSEFSGSDYVHTNSIFDTTQNFEIIVKINTGTIDSSYLNIICRNAYGDTPGNAGFLIGIFSNKLRTYLDDTEGTRFVNGQYGISTFRNNTDYLIKFSQIGNIITLESSSDNGLSWITENTWTHQYKIRNSGQGVAFGAAGTTAHLDGSIDFNNSYITINNARYQFQLPDDATTRAINITAATGNNLTLSGNAIIDNNETLANVDSSSSCISPTLPTEFRTMEMLFKVKYPNASSGVYIPIVGFGGTDSYRRVGGNGSTGHNLIYSSSVTLIQIPLTDFDFVEAAKNGYYVKLNVIKGSSNYRYKLSLSMDKIIWVSKEVVSEYNVCSGTVSLLRTVSGSAGGKPQMFLEETYIKVDNNYIIKGYLLDSDRAIATGKGWGITG